MKIYPDVLKGIETTVTKTTLLPYWQKVTYSPIIVVKNNYNLEQRANLDAGSRFSSRLQIITCVHLRLKNDILGLEKMYS